MVLGQFLSDSLHPRIFLFSLYMVGRRVGIISYRNKKCPLRSVFYLELASKLLNISVCGANFFPFFCTDSILGLCPHDLDLKFGRSTTILSPCPLILKARFDAISPSPTISYTQNCAIHDYINWDGLISYLFKKSFRFEICIQRREYVMVRASPFVWSGLLEVTVRCVCYRRVSWVKR